MKVHDRLVYFAGVDCFLAYANARKYPGISVDLWQRYMNVSKLYETDNAVNIYWNSFFYDDNQNTKVSQNIAIGRVSGFLVFKINVLIKYFSY